MSVLCMYWIAVCDGRSTRMDSISKDILNTNYIAINKCEYLKYNTKIHKLY